MYCAKCGNQIQEGVRFCPVCGNPVSAGAAPYAQPQPQPQPTAYGYGYAPGYAPAYATPYQDDTPIPVSVKLLGLLAAGMYLISIVLGIAMDVINGGYIVSWLRSAIQYQIPMLLIYVIFAVLALALKRRSSILLAVPLGLALLLAVGNDIWLIASGYMSMSVSPLVFRFLPQVLELVILVCFLAGCGQSTSSGPATAAMVCAVLVILLDLKSASDTVYSWTHILTDGYMESGYVVLAIFSSLLSIAANICFLLGYPLGLFRKKQA